MCCQNSTRVDWKFIIGKKPVHRAVADAIAIVGGGAGGLHRGMP